VIEIVDPGPFTTVQDLGRPGWAAIGVGSSGAADRGSLRLANRLVGNPEGAAGFEATFGGLHLRALTDVLVALTGAATPIESDAPLVGLGLAVHLRAGHELRLRTPPRGLRSYVAVRGGIDAPEVLGSRSTDTLSALGPSPLRAGDIFVTGTTVDPNTLTEPSTELAPIPPAPVEPVLRLLPGPRNDWADPAGLLAAAYTVRSDSNRIGVRLAGPALARRPGELPSEAMVRGSVQVPPDGLPIIVHADHPVTGGYPVVAVVVDADLDLVGQLRPGDPVRFRLVERPATAARPGARSEAYGRRS